MEGYSSTGQSPKWALVPTEEEEMSVTEKKFTAISAHRLKSCGYRTYW
jgi:hypothetical protein